VLVGIRDSQAVWELICAAQLALISSPRPGTVHPNSSAIRSIGPIIDLSAPSAAANEAFGFAAGP
jgi:hypothetical protein